MKRGGSKEKINDLIKKIRDKVPGIALRTTVMVGFPGEKKEDFIELKDWLEETKFERLGCFTYSHEENTGAFDLIDDVSEAEKEKRASQIMSQQAEISLQMNHEKIDKIFKCIVDRVEGKNFICRTEMDSPDVDNEILVDASKFYLRRGDFCNIKIKNVSEFDLFGEPVNN
jgi:ribosomal protein S12 methylthiotransferase